jgi:hypothetical protein
MTPYRLAKSYRRFEGAAVSTFRALEVQHYDMAVTVYLIDKASHSARLENFKTTATASSHATALKSRFNAFYIAKLQKGFL